MKRINFITLLAAQETQDEEEAIGSSFAPLPSVEPAPPSWKVAETRSSYNPTCLSSHSPLWPPPTFSSGPHLQSMTPLEDLTWMQYFDPLALSATPPPPSSPDSSPPGSPCSCYRCLGPPTVPLPMGHDNQQWRDLLKDLGPIHRWQCSEHCLLKGWVHRVTIDTFCSTNLALFPECILSYCDTW